MSSLILKRASATRQSGEWNEDDFDVVADGAVVGRIFLSPAAREATPTNLMLGKALTPSLRGAMLQCTTIFCDAT
jgi:hypothetical protein